MENYFDESVAPIYDETESDEFDDESIDATVDFLAELAGNGRASSSASERDGSASRSPRAVWRCTASTSPSRWWRS